MKLKLKSKQFFFLIFIVLVTGLFMALQPKIIACGNSIATFAMAVRFLTGPAVMAAASIAIGLRGTLLHIAIVQVKFHHVLHLKLCFHYDSVHYLTTLIFNRLHCLKGLSHLCSQKSTMCIRQFLVPRKWKFFNRYQ